MDSTRFMYLSMAMFTRPDAMFHPGSVYTHKKKKIRLKQQKKNKNMTLFNNHKNTRYFLWVAASRLTEEIISQGLGQ